MRAARQFVRRHARRRVVPGGLLAAALALSVVAVPSVATPNVATGNDKELSETTRLADRRSLVVGDRAYAMGDETGRYPATGWHIRGEMGGFWTPPLKLLDGIWFAADGAWLGADVEAGRYTSGHGYQRIDYRDHDGLAVERTDSRPRPGPRDRGRTDPAGAVQPDRPAGRRRALRTDAVIPLGLDHAERRPGQPARHRVVRERQPAVPRQGHPAGGERGPARLRGRGRLVGASRHRTNSDRTTAGRRTRRSSARPTAPRRLRTATTRRTAAAPAAG